MSKPCESTCQKCGGDDICLLFRPYGSSYKANEYGRGNNRFTSVSGWVVNVYRDHIDYTCRTCQFRWQTPPMPKPRKTKPADSPQEASDA